MNCAGGTCGLNEEELSKVYMCIAERMLNPVYNFLNATHGVIAAQYIFLIRDTLGVDDVLILEYMQLLWWPTVVCFILPLAIVILVCGSALFLRIYKWRNRLTEAYTHDFWDGARQTLAVLWEGQAKIWHGYEVDGLDNIPTEGPALLIYYHGALPIDMYYMIAKLVLYKKRLIHPVGDRFLFYIPGFQTLMEVFQVQAGSVESCTRLLQDGHIVAIAPGGVREALFSHEYELLWGNRTGFAKIALASGAPVIPIFTMNLRQAFNTLSLGQSIFRVIYEVTRLPIALWFGGFPVKLKTYVGNPIYPLQQSITAEELAVQVHSAVESMVKKHQRLPGNILLALLDRFF